MLDSLAKYWKTYDDAVLKSATPEIRGFVRATFYAGAKACFTLCNLYANGAVSEEDAVKILLNVQRELEAHVREVTKASNRNDWSEIQ